MPPPIVFISHYLQERPSFVVRSGTNMQCISHVKWRCGKIEIWKYIYETYIVTFNNPQNRNNGCTHKDIVLYTNLMRIIYKPHSYRRFPKTETMDACMKKYKPHAFLRSLTKTPADKNTRNLHIFSLDKNTWNLHIFSHSVYKLL